MDLHGVFGEELISSVDCGLLQRFFTLFPVETFTIGGALLKFVLTTVAHFRPFPFLLSTPVIPYVCRHGLVKEIMTSLCCFAPNHHRSLLSSRAKMHQQLSHFPRVCVSLASPE